MNDLAEIQELLKIDGEKLAQILGTTPDTVLAWQSGKAAPDPGTRKTLQNMLCIVKQIRAWAPREKLLAWLQTPDPDFFDLPPIDLLGSDYATQLLSNTLRQFEVGVG